MIGAMDERRPVQDRVDRARRDAATTPGRLRLQALSIATASIALAVIGTGTLLAAWLNVRVMQQQAAPAMIGMEHVHAWLSDADRAAVGGYLSGGSSGDISQLQYTADIAASNFDPLGRLNPDDLQQRYAADIAAASREIERATESGVGGDAANQKLQLIAVQIGNYAQQIQSANATDADAATRIFRLQSASNLMHGQLGILAQVDSVGAIYAAQMEGAHTALQITAGFAVLYFAVAAVLLFLLIRTQGFVRTRFRRRRNARLLAATLVLVVVAAGAGVAAARAAQTVNEAQSRSLIRLQNFWTARALTYDANGNTYLTLAAPASADKFIRAFTSATTQLADRPLTEQMLREAGTGQVNFNGILADEIRMAGSDEDRAAVVALATAYQRYLQADKAVRDAAAHSGLGDPAFVQAQRQLTSAFSQLDWRLGVVIQNQQSEFDGDMSAGALTLEVAGVITVLAGLVALLAYWGLRPRMAEYTAGASASQSTSRPESRPHTGVLEAG